jgi:low affinity Fe/Cu permease
MALALSIIFFSWALSRHVLDFALGSSAVFVGWWFLALLVFGRLPPLGFGEAVALYIVATAIIAALLAYARMLVRVPSA